MRKLKFDRNRYGNGLLIDAADMSTFDGSIVEAVPDFHVIGTIADTVFKEGAYRLRPDAGRGGSQALDLQPAQGGFIEFTFDEEGFYPFVTHKFATAEIGALGLFQVGDVELPAGGAGH